MRFHRKVWFATAALSLLATGCFTGAIFVGTVAIDAATGGGSDGGGRKQPVNARPTAFITTNFPAGVILRETVTIDFTVADPESDPVDLFVEASIDGGATYLPATVSGNTTGLPATPVGHADSFVWDTYATVGSTSQNDVRLRITPFDPGQGTSSTTANLEVDNTHLPDIYEVDNDAAAANPLVPGAAAQVHSIHEAGDVDYVSINVTAVTQRYTIETSNLVGGDTYLTVFDTDGTSILAVNDDKPGGGLDSRIDIIFPVSGTYFAQVRDSVGGFLYTYDLGLVVVPPTAPSAVVDTPAGMQSGPVTISYTLTDPDGNDASINAEFSLNGGASFAPATESIGPPSEGTTALATSAQGETHIFVWDSLADIGTTDQLDVQIRITPSDAASGTPSSTGSFRVDNVAPRIASVEYLDTDDNGQEIGDEVVVTFDEEIVLGSGTVSAYVLPVAGDGFGNGASVTAGPGPDQVTIFLGGGPVFLVSGLFDPGFVTPGSPSGLDVNPDLPSNAITDLAGNEAESSGGADVDSQDTTAPFLASATAQALSGIANDEVAIAFSEPVNPADAGAIGSFALESPAGSPIDPGTATIAYDPSIRTTRIVLTDTGAQMDNLPYGGSFRVTVSGVRDVAGNPITPGSTLSGTVIGDSVPPVLLTVQQNLNAGPGGDTVDLRFDEAMDPLTAGNPIHYVASGGLTTLGATVLPGLFQIRLTFDAAITPGATTLDVSDIRDLAGNVVAPISGRSISVNDPVPPGLTGATATAVQGLVNDVVTVTFDEPVVEADATNLANFSLESPIGVPRDITASQIGYNGASSVTTIVLTNPEPDEDDLKFGDGFRIIVSNVQDLAGNPIVPGSFVDGTVVGDGVPPQITEARQDLALDATGATVVVFFDEPLDRTTAESTPNYTASGGVTALSASLRPAATAVEVVLSAPVTSGKDTFGATSVEDPAGNAMLGSLGLTITSTDSTPPSATILSPANGADVPGNVEVTGTASDDHSVITSVLVNGVPASTTDGYANWAASISLPVGLQPIVVRTEDFNGNVDPSAASITVNVQGNTPPKATLTTPSGTQQGDVPIPYRLIDADSDTLSIVVEYSLDGGSAYYPATESTDPLSDGTTGLSSSPNPGTSHFFVWDSISDMGASSTSEARIRITPSDAVQGTAGATSNFTVDNTGDLGPFVVSAVYDDVDGNGPDVGDRIWVTFNEPVLTNVLDPSPFSLPVSGDSFGIGASIRPGEVSTEIEITLGTSPILTIPGRFETTGPLDPSGIDIATPMLADAIEDSGGTDAISSLLTWSAGTGADGAFDSTTYGNSIPGITRSGSLISVDTDEASHQGLFQFTTFTLAAGHTLEATGTRPLQIRSTGTLRIDGIVDLSGNAGGASGLALPAGSGGSPRAGGESGGNGGDQTGASGAAGKGAGGGGGGLTAVKKPGGGGGGASFATRGVPGQNGADVAGGPPGASYGDPYILPVRGGSGGGGGGGTADQTTGGGGGGGAGGGALSLSAGGGVTVSGSILLDGGDGGAASGTAAGGGGSGGSILIQTGGDITISSGASLLALGGAGGIPSGSGATKGGAGGDGRIRLVDSDGVISTTGVIDPLPSIASLRADIGEGFRGASALLEPRRSHEAILLWDGTVLLGAGWTNLVDGASSFGMIYDPVDGSFSATGPMDRAFAHRAATVLPDGDVLFTGGLDSNRNPRNECEIYLTEFAIFDPITPPMTWSRADHTSTLLPTGVVVIVGGGTDVVETYDPAEGIFKQLAAPLNDERAGHSATLLRDGRLLVAGGHEFGTALATTEIYDIGTETFSLGPTLNEARAFHASALLPTGEVLLAGGEAGGLPVDSAEVYDPGTDTITLLSAKLSEPRSRLGEAIILPDGRVLLAGGGSFTADVFDPWLRTFRRVDRFLAAPRADHTVTRLPSGEALVLGGLETASNIVLDATERFAIEPDVDSRSHPGTRSPGLERSLATLTPLPDGRVLLAGGDAGTGAVDSAEIFDPVTETWQPTGSMLFPRKDHTAILLPSGFVLVVGGIDDFGGALDLAEIYDPGSGTWNLTVGLMSAPKSAAAMALLRRGRVLICGGRDAGGTADDSAELYDIETDSFIPVGSMARKRWGHTITLLPDGEVVVAGGVDATMTILDSLEGFDPDIEIFSLLGQKLTVPRAWHRAELQPDGLVLISGGTSDGVVATSTTDQYDDRNDLVKVGPPMTRPRLGHGSIALPNGTILILGGQSSVGGGVHANGETYSYVSNAFSATGTTISGRSFFSIAPLGNGRVLAVGGGTGAELYVP